MSTTIESVDSGQLDQEQLYRLTFENTAVGIAQANKNGQLLDVNNKVLDITGYTKEELLQKTFQEITHPDDLEVDLQYVEAIYRREIDSFSMEKRYIRKDGDIIWVKLTGSAIFDIVTDEFRMFIGVIEDISEKKRMEEALHRKEQHYKIVSSAAKIGTFYRDFQTGENYWSPECLRIYGIMNSDSLKLKDDLPEAIHPDDRDEVLKQANQFIHHGNSKEFNSDHRIILPDGAIRWVNVRGVIEKKHPTRIYGIVMDITERKHVEEALRYNKKILQNVLEVLPVGVFISDEHGNLAQTNRAAEKLWGGIKHIPIEDLK